MEAPRFLPFFAMRKLKQVLNNLGPGLLLAATGIGVGDMVAATVVGAKYGFILIWALAAGVLLKFIITEGLARWQLATGTTLMEGWRDHLPPAVLLAFFGYFLIWTYFVSAALVVTSAMVPAALFPGSSQPMWGFLHAILAAVLVYWGTYERFVQIMKFMVALMFSSLISANLLILYSGARWTPTEPAEISFVYALSLIGGVGGTVTLLSYGYWMREAGRSSPSDLWVCRVDLGVGYAVTGIFGVCMVIIGSNIEIEGQGTELLVTLSNRLAESLGPIGKWVFLIGAFGAVFSSLLGVWQAVPYLFADCWRLLRSKVYKDEVSRATAVNTQSLPYQSYLLALAGIPMLGLFWSFQEVQKLYTVTGALFFPFLALALLVFNGRTDWVGPRFKNRLPTTFSLLAILAFFAWVAVKRFAAT